MTKIICVCSIREPVIYVHLSISYYQKQVFKWVFTHIRQCHCTHHRLHLKKSFVVSCVCLCEQPYVLLLQVQPLLRIWLAVTSVWQVTPAIRQIYRQLNLTSNVYQLIFKHHTTCGAEYVMCGCMQYPEELQLDPLFIIAIAFFESV